jgi:hypothetical protein
VDNGAFGCLIETPLFYGQFRQNFIAGWVFDCQNGVEEVHGKNRSVPETGRPLRLGEGVFCVVGPVESAPGLHDGGAGGEYLSETTAKPLGVEGRLAEDLTEPAGFSQEVFEHCVTVWRFLGNQGWQVEVNGLTEAEKEVAWFKEWGFQVACFEFGDTPDEEKAGGMARFHCRDRRT